MKKMMIALLSLGVVTSAMAYVTPTEDQIDRILADHSQLNAALQGASPAQAAETVSRALAEINSSTVPPASKQQTAALLYVRALLLSGENAPDMAGALAGLVEKDFLPTMAAATAVAVGSAEGPVSSSIQQTGGSGLASAANDPASVLGPDLIALIQQLVIELRGVAAPVIPPPATAPLSLIPPIVPRGAGAPTPPPVASTYVNQ